MFKNKLNNEYYKIFPDRLYLIRLIDLDGKNCLVPAVAISLPNKHRQSLMYIPIAGDFFPVEYERIISKIKIKTT